MDRKKMFMGCALAAVLILGCSDTPSAGAGAGEKSLAYSVYAGVDAAGSWSTFAFTKNGDGKDVLYYFPDNAACYEGSYVYDDAAKSGNVPGVTAMNQTAKDRPPLAAPGVFTVSADEKTITFTAYSGGAERSFPRRRGRGGNRGDDDPPPSGLAPLNASSNLDGTVWAATAYRTRDWTTLSITSSSVAAGTIAVSHSFDCTSFPRNYGVCSCVADECLCDSCTTSACTCRGRDAEGNGGRQCGCRPYVYNAESYLYYIGPFKVAGDKFTFLDFYGHGGTITLTRMK
jgi:hypothetical protein